MSFLVPPFNLYLDRAGNALEDGRIYVGETPDAISNPIDLFWDEARTIPAEQPVRTTAGYPTYQGRPAQLFMEETECLITVQQGNGETVVSNAIGRAFMTAADLRELRGSVNVDDYIDPDNPDDGPAFEAAAAVFGGEGGTVYAPGFYTVTSDVSVPHNILIQGPYGQAGTPGTNASHDYTTIAHISLDPAATFRLAPGSSISGIIILNSDMTFPQATSSNFGGIAVTIEGDDASVYNSMILGFEKCIYSNGYQRPRLINNNIDGINGIEIAACFDIPHLENIQAWPFVTVGGGGGNDGAYRSGKAFYFHSTVDWARVSNCFAYGYKQGFYIDSCSDGHYVACSVDAAAFTDAALTGFTFRGDGIRNRIIGGTNSTQLIGVDIDVVNGVDNALMVMGMSFFPTVAVAGGTGIKIGASSQQAVVQAIGNSFYRGIGIDTSSPSAGIATANRFDTCVPPINAGGTNVLLSSLFGNVYVNCTDNLGQRLSLVNMDPGVNYATFGTSGGAVVRNLHSRGAPHAQTPVQAGDPLVALAGAGHTGAGAYPDGGSMRLQVSGTVSATALPTTWVWGVCAAGEVVPEDALALNSASLFPPVDDVMSLGSAAGRWVNAYVKNLLLYPPASNAPTINGEMVFELTSNTELKIKVQGSDGTDRSVSLTLAP